EETYNESDFYGVEIARKLFQICEQRKENGDFDQNNVFFLRKNAVSGLVFPRNSINTIHTSSLTHEIASYGDIAKLKAFIQNRFEELTMGGVWINRDVVGPKNKEEIVYVQLNDSDGEKDKSSHLQLNEELTKEEKQKYLDSLSTYERFFVFQKEFRRHVSYSLWFERLEIEGLNFLKMKLGDICEYLSKKDYTDNWDSEMYESFCFWSFDDWLENVKDIGFKIHSKSTDYTNDWLIKHRYDGKVKIFTTTKNNPNKISDLLPTDWPVTHMLLIANK
ncbi:transferase, partial [Leptospira sp. 96542]|nr:transferase [Leptospira sp. 96542]